MEEELETNDSLNVDETLDSNLETTEEVVEETNEELTKAQELAKNYRIRAEKAEQALKQAKTAKKDEPKEVLGSLPIKDLRALQNVHDDDIEKVEKWAKSENLSISEAVKDPLIQSYLKVRNEERSMAQATNTGVARRGSNQPSDDMIVDSFSKGTIPSKDEDIQRLVNARMNLKRAVAKGN